MATPPGPDPEDLTARARIRDAALRHFGDDGFEKATIRGIARTAGVSPGLVRHHFGSKQALREACDEHLMKMIRRLNDQVRADTTLSDVSYVGAARAAMAPYQLYLARSLADGSAASIFDEMTRICEEWIAGADAGRPDPPDVPAKIRAAVFTAMALGIPVLAPHISRAMGVDMFSPEGDLLLSRALVDLYSHPLMAPEDAARARAGLDRLAGARPPGRRTEENSP